MTPPAEPAAAGTVLVVCKDARTRQLIIESLQPLALRPEVCEELLAAAGLLDKRKFEAVIVDLQLGEEALLIMEQLRLSRANRTAVTFAINTGAGPTLGASPDSTFVLQRPLSAAAISQVLRAAYGLMVRERRRYFRCPVAVPVLVRVRQTAELLCQTVNVSEGGLAMNAPEALDTGHSASVRLNLPDRSSQFFAQAKVCWRDQSGLVGLEFQSLASPQRAELQEWLARKLDETLPENVTALFRSVGQSSP